MSLLTQFSVFSYQEIHQIAWTPSYVYRDRKCKESFKREWPNTSKGGALWLNAQSQMEEPPHSYFWTWSKNSIAISNNIQWFLCWTQVYIFSSFSGKSNCRLWDIWPIAIYICPIFSAHTPMQDYFIVNDTKILLTFSEISIYSLNVGACLF